ncbi:MAG TPA: hypothetical protein PLI48_04940 [Gammaproteobacteria bacterium]|nr:hypothetical protein [Gammaproteobacteria bacterium]HRP87395.1 hypothetical protein [Gammaproteobacteria bacterium]
MNKSCLRAAALLAVVLLPLGWGSAAADSFAVGAKAGTTGLGLEATWRLTDAVNLRGGYYAFDYDTDLEEEGVEYDGDLRLRNAALFADWHPFGGAFRISAGGVQSGNKFLGSADGELEVGDNTYTGQLEAEVSWSGLAPYLGIGFGNAMRGGRLSFSFDLGVMFTGAPDVRLDGSVNDPALEDAFAEDLARERANLEDELSDAKYYPVVSLGFAYRF